MRSSSPQISIICFFKGIYKKKLFACFSFADVARNSSFMPVLSACTHALTSTFPNTRYVIGYDAWLVHLPLTYLPTWIPDWIYALPECSYTHSNIATGIASGYQN